MVPSMGESATAVILGCEIPESLSQLFPPSELLKRPSSEVPAYTTSGSSGSTARHLAPRPSSVRPIRLSSTIATAAVPAVYRRVISTCIPRRCCVPLEGRDHGLWSGDWLPSDQARSATPLAPAMVAQWAQQ